jgi:glycosyltransferase involved in cell wall biosynthesis
MISIILPTYNSIQFLKERVATILNQTYTDWECIVIDGQSTDGTMEYLTEVAQTDKRFHLYQFPPQGVYDAWNKGIQVSRGSFVYFATSDDTMATNCLEILRNALEKNKNCSIAHCCLTIINEYGSVSDQLNWNTFPAQVYYEDKTNVEHIRQAPLDGILHCTHGTVYHSFTQLLIKKEVFDTFGAFLTNCGTIADFEWAMRVALCVNIVHVPEYLATWRFYEGQSTSLAYFNSWQHKLDIMLLIEKAIKNASLYSNPTKSLNLYQLWMAKEMLTLKSKSNTPYNLKDYYLKLLLLFYKKPLKRRLTFHNFLLG